MASEIAARLKNDVVASMKGKDRERLQVLRMLQSAIKQVEVDERRELSDEDVMKVLQSYAKKVRDARDGARQGGREDLAEAAEAELAIVEEYLPAAMSDAELQQVVADAVAATGAQGMKDMGNVMKAVMPKVTGRAEGGRVSAEVKRQLAG